MNPSGLISLVGLIIVTGHLQSAEMPNIVVIIADDLGWADVGFHGSDIETPVIDELAREGAKLERFYALPMCTPTRAAFLTGRYPFRYGLQSAAIPSDAKYGLNLNERLLPELLREIGYTTAIVGKWHLGHGKQEFWPKARGFDSQYGPLVGEIDYFSHEAGGKRDWYDDELPSNDSGYATELIGDRSEQIIHHHDFDSPLFLWLAFTAPHAPYQVPKAYRQRYSNIVDETRQIYAGMVSCMDEQIGKVVAALDAQKVREETLIVFMSDNGGNRSAAFSGESDVSNINLPASNLPYRGGKGTLLEGGCRVVACVNWPGRIPRSQISEPIHVTDIFPTLLRFSGARIPGNIDGKEQTQLLTTGVGRKRQSVVYNLEPYRAAISSGEWKLIVKR